MFLNFRRKPERLYMVNIMTDKQMEIILNLVADKFAACETMEEVKEAVEEVKGMASTPSGKKSEFYAV